MSAIDNLATRRHPALLARAPIVLALAVVVAFVVSGCGSTQSVSSKSPAEILAASRAAALSASSVHVLTKVSIANHQVVDDDLELARDGGRAKLFLLGRRYEVIRIGSTLYLKGGRAFYKRLDQATGAHLPPGTWVKAPADARQLAQFAYFTDLSEDLGFQLRSTAPLTKGATTMIAGRKAIELKSTAGKRSTSARYIASTGKPYPLQIVQHGRETGLTTFTAWDDPVALSAPAGAVALSALGRRRGG